MPPIGRKKCLLRLVIHRLHCVHCGKLYWPLLPFMVGQTTYVKAFALTVMDLLLSMTIKGAAEFLGVGWDLIKNIHESRLKIKYREIHLNKIKYIGIDEFSLKKRHKYMTIFTDQISGRVIYAVEGRSKEDINPFLQKLKRRAK